MSQVLIMVIVDTQYGSFPEINHLNKNFVPERDKLKITLDVISSEQDYKAAFPEIVEQFFRLFPNLNRHQCCHGKRLGSSRMDDSEPILGARVKAFRRVIDVIHLIEHVIIELQCDITRMNMCSGITGHYWMPPNRYDIFVECIDPRVGLFSSRIAIEIVRDLLIDGVVTQDYARLIGFAKYLYQHPELVLSSQYLASLLGWSPWFITSAIDELIHLQFLNPAQVVDVF